MEYLKQGPWPKCVGMTADACKGMIENIADDVDVYIIDENEEIVDFDSKAVYVRQKDGMVVDIPGRGY